MSNVRLSVMLEAKAAPHPELPQRNIQFFFEVEAEDLFDALDMFNEDGCLVGNRIVTEKDASGRLIVVSEVPTAICKAGVATISAAHRQYFHPQEVAGHA